MIRRGPKGDSTSSESPTSMFPSSCPQVGFFSQLRRSSSGAVDRSKIFLGGAVLVALTVAGCILILAGAVALAEITRFKVRQLVRKREKPGLSEPRNKGGLNA